MEFVKPVFSKPRHKIHASAFEGIRDQNLRTIFHGFEMRENSSKFLKVMPVAARHFPPKDAKLFLQFSKITRIFYMDVRLNFITIHNHRDLGKLMVGSWLQRFPNLALLQLSVSGQNIHAAGFSLKPFGLRHAARFGNSHTQRSGIGSDAGRVHIRMPGQASETAEFMNHI